jgi:hypothetical protein
LELLVLTEPSPVVTALTLRLLASETDLVPKWCVDLADSLQLRLIAPIVSEPDSIVKVLALLLCRANPRNTLEAFQRITPVRA